MQTFSEAGLNQTDVAMEEEKQNTLTSTCPSQDGNSSSTPDLPPPENLPDGPTLHMSRLGTVIPNRIFVGGIDYKVNESDLQHFFSQHGAVKEVKIVIDRSGMSKGYGFVTFETQEDALKILHNANGICFKDKKLSIGQAVRKQQVSGHSKSVHVACPDPAVPLPMSCGTLYLTTSTGYPYTYHNGVAYFHCPNMNPPAHQWPPSPPLMLPQTQPVYQQPTYQHNQCVPNQYQWTVAPSPMPSGPVVYSQLPEHLYQPVDGGCVLPPLPVMEDTTTEFVEPTLQQFNRVYPQRAEGLTPIVLQHDPGKSLVFAHPRVHLKPNYRRHIHHKDYHYLPEATEPPDATMFHAAQPLMDNAAGLNAVIEADGVLILRILSRGQEVLLPREVGLVIDHERPALHPAGAALTQHRGPFRMRLYERENFGGQMHELMDNDCDNMMDRFRMSDCQSCNVMDGHWLMFEQPNYRGRMLYLRPGEYRNLREMGMNNMSRFSSIRRIMDSC